MKADAIVQNGIVKTLCRMCDTRCGTGVYLRDGIMVDIRPNEDNPVNKGRMCNRGVAAIDLFYHPDRILKPRKRLSDGNFSEISWDQAMDEISARMLKIKKTYGARAIAAWKGEALGFFQQEEDRVDGHESAGLSHAVHVGDGRRDSKRCQAGGGGYAV
ncbi:MAG: hypothetical protein B6I22_03370 [Desulfobacteraceae bacterium 4572_123]|nr:MAG: hypothetical protein B6I22_03370 [Desulfobacteraceae bacterium 4572_123]